MSGRSNFLTGAIAFLGVLGCGGAFAGSPTVVISQVYGGGGNPGAQYKNDFIELHNNGTSAVSMANWTVQYLDITNNTWQRTFLGGFSSIGPGQYFLIQEAQGLSGSLDLPTPNASSSVNLSATSGKVALVSNSTLLSGSCPSGAEIVDFVGYGSANCSEGSAAPAPGNTTAILRTSNGCDDSDNNGTDFEVGVPNPRNTSTTTISCPPSGPLFTGWGPTQNGSFTLQFTADVTRSNLVQFSSNLITWAVLTAAVSHVGNLFTCTDTNGARSRFYRILSQ